MVDPKDRVDDIVARLCEGQTLDQIAAAMEVDSAVLCSIVSSERGRTEVTRKLHSGQLVSRAVVSAFNTKEALERVFEELNDGLGQTDWDKTPRTRLGILGEMRQVISLGMDIMKTMYTVEEVQKFQRTVLDLVGRLSPDLQKEFIAELGQQKMLNSITTAPRRDSI